jgi:hypothetical protein
MSFAMVVIGMLLVFLPASATKRIWAFLGPFGPSLFIAAGGGVFLSISAAGLWRGDRCLALVGTGFLFAAAASALVDWPGHPRLKRAARLLLRCGQLLICAGGAWAAIYALLE